MGGSGSVGVVMVIALCYGSGEGGRKTNCVGTACPRKEEATKGEMQGRM